VTRGRSLKQNEPVSQPSRRKELLAEEDRLWTELDGLVDSLPAEKVDEPGYFIEGWTAKDLVAHIGSWLAEAGVVLEQIRVGSYRPHEIDVDAMNARFYEAMHDVAFQDVRAQGVAARNRMLRAWRSLPDPSAEADRWISKSGPEHYAEHLPRLREWVRQLSRPEARADPSRAPDIVT
jgi:Mycothiol maleylpyruvate isomerase N-terminal domain